MYSFACPLHAPWFNVLNSSLSVSQALIHSTPVLYVAFLQGSREEKPADAALAAADAQKLYEVGGKRTVCHRDSACA